MITRAVPKKLAELGRIRIGHREPNESGVGTHPEKLRYFRLTSPNRSLLKYAAEQGQMGGEVREWVGESAPRDEDGRPTQYELYTTVDAIDVLIPTFSAISLSFERWGQSGCHQRCTGEVITECPLQDALVGTACACPADDLERAALASKGKACARILRLNVLLPDLPGAGAWRLETKGYYATAELMGTLDMLQRAGQEHQIIEAVLRLEPRVLRRVGKGEGKGTLHFAVPVLWPKYTSRQILSGAPQVLLTPAAPPASAPALAQHIADLYGDPATPPAGEAGAEYIPLIEALIAKSGGRLEQNLAAWYRWAEDQYKKSTAEFTVEDWQAFLAKVRKAADDIASRAAQKAQDAAQDATSAQDVSGVVSGEKPPLEAHGASQEPAGGADLFLKEEREDYGND